VPIGIMAVAVTLLNAPPDRCALIRLDIEAHPAR